MQQHFIRHCALKERTQGLNGAAPDWVQLDHPNATVATVFFSVAPLRSPICLVQAVVERLSLSCRMFFEEKISKLRFFQFFGKSQPSVSKQNVAKNAKISLKITHFSGEVSGKTPISGVFSSRLNQRWCPQRPSLGALGPLGSPGLGRG